MLSKELYADRFAQGNVLMGICQESCLVVSNENLNLVAVTATAQQELAVGRDVELARVGRRGLVANASEQSGLTVDREDGDAFGFQTIAGIKKAAIGTQVDIRAASCLDTV